jgi:hypothetical protein
MKQREVQDAEGTRWTCVQALAGVEGAAADAAAERVESGGTVPVVCTPSGGAETVRVRLQSGWEETTSDDALLAAIAGARPSDGSVRHPPTPRHHTP